MFLFDTEQGKIKTEMSRRRKIQIALQKEIRFTK